MYIFLNTYLDTGIYTEYMMAGVIRTIRPHPRPSYLIEGMWIFVQDNITDPGITALSATFIYS